ncbi:ATP synthase I chain [Candidatus Kryptobacter tengchongensis]|uniref:ATP synthase I chain n=1 Tax=Kryptobacter tengchongensis TaxID=1643429 RepID=A0A656D1G3_KRYT1|nr:ATP synthase subunit I [Candidatus Kryptobacter tengchongensis]CUS96920.1 ATP synthase I chain [Candidatus Kryptobacter tengchongensis]CUS97815.1 ATP synthase I chain [Candidatus Kryptobacter tengchongensis]CUU03021.1 ATP synthase I chain [Candidatus Kryptobacter tengchongensis]CUU03444.1 ATP synthase I chain [Candidatus Kryptobacter tengchongensis]
MRIDVKKFLKNILIATVLVWLLISYPLIKFASGEFIRSFIVGSLISFVNSVIGIFVLKQGIAKPDKEFLKLTFGSMGIRLFAIAGLILLMLEVLNFEIYGLVMSLLLFYFIFLGVEIFYLSKLTTKKEF